MRWFPEFKVNSDGELIGWGAVLVNGFSLEYFEEELEFKGAEEAVKWLNYL